MNPNIVCQFIILVLIINILNNWSLSHKIKNKNNDLLKRDKVPFEVVYRCIFGFILLSKQGKEVQHE